MDENVRMGCDTSRFWQQLGGIHTAMINEGQSVGLAAYIQRLADALNAGTLKVTVEPKVPAVTKGDYVCVSELRLSGDLDALRSAPQTGVVDGVFVGGGHGQVV